MSSTILSYFVYPLAFPYRSFEPFFLLLCFLLFFLEPISTFDFFLLHRPIVGALLLGPLGRSNAQGAGNHPTGHCRLLFWANPGWFL